MKNKLFISLSLVASIAGALMLSSFKSSHAGLIQVVKSNQTTYYIGDTADEAYAIYGNGTGSGATVTEVISYSTHVAYNASGYTYLNGHDNNFLWANFTAYNSSNSPFYSYNGRVVQ